MPTVIPTSKLVNFSSVKPGNVLVSTETGNKYVRISSSETDMNAANLETGKLARFDNSEKVLVYPNSNLTIVAK